MSTAYIRTPTDEQIKEMSKNAIKILDKSYKIKTLNNSAVNIKNPKRSFVRGVWGVPDINFLPGKNRRIKVANDILFAKINPYEPPLKVYVFGEDNYKILSDMGFNCVLINKNPYIYERPMEEYRHKMEIWRHAQQEFDEMVFLDWDCIPLRPIDYDFWDVMQKGAKIQATIYMYMKEKALWRMDKDPRKISAATFVYMREPDIANDIINIWKNMGKPWREELALTLYIEKLNNGWKGIEDYRKSKFEPPYHTLFYHYDNAYKNSIMLKYNTFFHMNKNKIQCLLGNENNVNDEDVIKRLSSAYASEILYINKQNEKIIK